MNRLSSRGTGGESGEKEDRRERRGQLRRSSPDLTPLPHSPLGHFTLTSSFLALLAAVRTFNLEPFHRFEWNQSINQSIKQASKRAINQSINRGHHSTIPLQKENLTPNHRHSHYDLVGFRRLKRIVTKHISLFCIIFPRVETGQFQFPFNPLRTFISSSLFLR